MNSYSMNAHCMESCPLACEHSVASVLLKPAVNIQYLLLAQSTQLDITRTNSHHPSCFIMIGFHLENRCLQHDSDLAALPTDSQLSFGGNDTFNDQEQGFSDRYFDAQGIRHSQDEIRRPQGPIRAPFLSSSRHNDNNTSFAYLQPSILPPIQTIFASLEREDDLQQVQAGPNATLVPSSSAVLSTQRDSCPVSIPALLKSHER